MWKRVSVYAMAALYLAAGAMHFVRPAPYVRIVPSWVPDAEAAVLWSGVAEVVLGSGLLWKRTRYFSALGITALLVAVFPANVRMAQDWVDAEHPAAWIAIVRLPLQAVLVWWAWKVRND